MVHKRKVCENTMTVADDFICPILIGKRTDETIYVSDRF